MYNRNKGKKLKIKYLLCGIFFAITCLIFAGCSEVYYGRIVLPNGQIVESVEIQLDTAAIRQKGYNPEHFLTCISDELKARFLQIKSRVLQGVEYSLQIPTQSKVVGQLSYDNYSVFCTVWEIDPDEPKENEVIKGLLYDKEILSKGKLVYAGESVETITKSINQRLAKYYPSGVDFTFQDVDCNYSYSVPLAQAKVERIKANCNYTVDEAYGDYSLRTYVWYFNHANPDLEMVLYKNHIHNWVWYALGIIITLVVMLIVLMIYFLKQKHKNKLMQNQEVKQEKIEIEK